MRRTVLAVVLIAVTSVVSACATPGGPSLASAPLGRQQPPSAPVPGSGAFPAALPDGSPESVGLNPAPIAAAQRKIAAWTERTPGMAHPMYAGAVSLLAHDGVVVSRRAAGYELRYVDNRGTELPPQQREKADVHTIFDIASLTKLFTSIAVLQLAEDGHIRLTDPVAKYVPEFASGGKETITVEQLLTHTSGLQAKIELWKLPPQQRIPAVVQAIPEHPPGTAYTYSDLNMITLGVLVERVSGEPLDQVVQDRITGPLGMTDTGFRPPQEKRDRIAATEFETDPPRGMVRGEVHDENAWSLGGVAGQAGMFSTADDLAVLGQALLDGGAYRGARILRPETVHEMLTNHTTAFPGNAHGWGFELDRPKYMAGLSGPHTAGHTGFTGTSLVIDPVSHSIVVLLTNTVHPTRAWGTNAPARQELAQAMAEALRR
jgi:serine-type D-Ala-D-Ala carboxypeptidase